MAEDLFDNLLNLEDKFYDEGFKQGKDDGERAGRIEGRSFGIEKGFEKFAESGRLYGKSIVWANRLPQKDQAKPESSDTTDTTSQSLPALSGGARLEKNIVTLHALVEPDTLSTDNNDESVNDFDDRVKRAQGKTKVIERQTGEEASKDGGSGSTEAAESKDGGSPPSSSKSPPSKEAVSF